LLAYRRAKPSLQHGSYQAVETSSADCYAFLRAFGEERQLIVLNFAGKRCQLTVAGCTAGTLTLSTELDRSGPVNLGNLALRPHEGVVIDLNVATDAGLHRDNVAGVDCSIGN